MTATGPPCEPSASPPGRLSGQHGGPVRPPRPRRSHAAGDCRLASGPRRPVLSRPGLRLRQRRAREGATTSPLPHVRLRLLLAGLCLALHFVTWFAALDRTPVARATLLACTTPLWTTLGSLLLGRRRPSARDGSPWPLPASASGLVTHAAAQTPTPTTLARRLVRPRSPACCSACICSAWRACTRSIPTQRQVTVTYSVAALALWTLLLLHGGVDCPLLPRRLGRDSGHDAGAADFRPHAAELVPAPLPFV